MPRETHEIRPRLGELLKHARRAAGLTQEALAARAGLSARVISDLERNVSHVPRPATVQLLVTALNLSDSERELFESAANLEHTGQPSSGRSEIPDRPPLTGRAKERALLERHLAGQGPPLLMLAGEPGIGKTRLLQEAGMLAAARGLHVLYGAAQAVGQDGAPDPIVDALRQAIHSRSAVHLRRDLQGCAWLVRVLPELAAGPIQPLPPPTVPAEHELALVARAVTRFLANVAGPDGTLLTLDNLQYADSDALRLLSRVLRTATDAPLRIVGAYRDTQAARDAGLSILLASLVHDQLMTHVTLPALSTDAAAALVQACVEDHNAANAALLDGVAQETGGVPFYLVAWAQDVNLLPIGTLSEHVPWPIRHSVRSRVESAPAMVRLALEAIAAAGGRATYPMLVTLTGAANGDLLKALESASQERLIQEDGEAYVFAYDVIRRAMEADLSRTRRALLRRRLATLLPSRVRAVPRGAPPAIAQNTPSDVAERAHHLAVLRRHRGARPG